MGATIGRRSNCLFSARFVPPLIALALASPVVLADQPLSESAIENLDEVLTRRVDYHASGGAARAVYDAKLGAAQSLLQSGQPDAIRIVLDYATRFQRRREAVSDDDAQRAFFNQLWRLIGQEAQGAQGPKRQALRGFLLDVVARPNEEIWQSYRGIAASALIASGPGDPEIVRTFTGLVERAAQRDGSVFEISPGLGDTWLGPMLRYMAEAVTEHRLGPADSRAVAEKLDAILGNASLRIEARYLAANALGAIARSSSGDASLIARDRLRNFLFARTQGPGQVSRGSELSLAIHAAAKSGETQALRALVGFYRNLDGRIHGAGDEHVRREIVEQLGMSGSREIIPFLAEVALTPRNDHLRRAANLSLAGLVGSTPGSDALDAIIQSGLRHPGDVLIALQNIDDRERVLRRILDRVPFAQDAAQRGTLIFLALVTEGVENRGDSIAERVRQLLVSMDLRPEEKTRVLARVRELIESPGTWSFSIYDDRQRRVHEDVAPYNVPTYDTRPMPYRSFSGRFDFSRWSVPAGTPYEHEAKIRAALLDAWSKLQAEAPRPRAHPSTADGRGPCGRDETDRLKMERAADDVRKAAAEVR